jgi:hypothetical protein
MLSVSSPIVSPPTLIPILLRALVQVLDQSDGATTETIFREMNEWEVDNDSRPSDGGVRSFLCECSDEGCSDPIGLTYVEYESVRSYPIRFAIALDHEDPEIDVIAEYQRFAVVEKVGAHALALARATDPRR